MLTFPHISILKNQRNSLVISMLFGVNLVQLPCNQGVASVFGLIWRISLKNEICRFFCNCPQITQIDTENNSQN